MLLLQRLFVMVDFRGHLINHRGQSCRACGKSASVIPCLLNLVFSIFILCDVHRRSSRSRSAYLPIRKSNAVRPAAEAAGISRHHAPASAPKIKRPPLVGGGKRIRQDKMRSGMVAPDSR